MIKILVEIYMRASWMRLHAGLGSPWTDLILVGVADPTYQQGSNPTGPIVILVLNLDSPGKKVKKMQSEKYKLRRVFFFVCAIRP
jgi:hypothetical protein